MTLTHEQCIKRNLMKHHCIEGRIALKKKEVLASELDKLFDTGISTQYCRQEQMDAGYGSVGQSSDEHEGNEICHI